MLNDLAAISTDKYHNIDHYKPLNTIGQGSFARVTLVRHVLTGTEVAVKAIHQQGSCRQLEVRCLKLLNHPNIVKLFEVIETKQRLFLVMELVCGMDMHRYLKHHSRLSENEARGMFWQLVSTMQYCHQQDIMHRDLRLENMLLDSDLNVKIIGFGLKKEFTGHEPSIVWSVATSLMSPQSSSWDRRVELGVLLYRMVTGTVPFTGDASLCSVSGS